MTGTDTWVPRAPDPALDVTLLPPKLSPSRALDFDQCPQKFFYGTICKRPSPPTRATTVGTLMHFAAEHLFDLPGTERTLGAALALVERGWGELTALESPDPEASTARHHAENAAGYRELAPAGSPAEAELLDHAREMVRRWFATEVVDRLDPLAREIHLEAALDTKVGPLTVHGVIDRLDRVPRRGRPRLYLSDYKTAAKIPQDRFLGKSFRAMRVYAALAAEFYGEIPDALRLVYVSAGSPLGVKREEVTLDTLDEAHTFLTSTWESMVGAATTGVWKTNTSKLCDWCPFKPVCPAHPSEAQF